MLSSPAVTSMALLRSLPKKMQPILKAQQRCFSKACHEEDDEPKPTLRKDLTEPPFKPPNIYKKPPTMWEHDECCEPPCDVFRHDVLYLKDKPKKYTRTWNECPDIEKMVYECPGEIEPPEILPANRSGCQAPTMKFTCKLCQGDENKLGLMICKDRPPLTGPCPKVRMPCCPKSREPPVCSKVVIHKCCQKRCTMYPAYSECNRKRPPVKKPIECLCLKIPSMCEVYAQFRKFALK